MALTATAQSAFREPAWDEVIVPTLRKRLQDESNVLARRISAISVGSVEDLTPDAYETGAFLSRQDSTTLPAQYHSNQKPSAIPRPSLQQSRTTAESPHNQGRPFQATRARTVSTPYAFDSPNSLDTATFSSASSRPTSPMINGKTTRIPMSRGRAGSTSSYGQGSMNGSLGRTEQELPPVEEGQRTHTSRSTVRLPHSKVSEIFNESAPFSTNSWISSQHEFEAEHAVPYRPSTDSEERPFEHWYRGDVSRNGGVGELRVGRREEMLDIANYGHTFRKATSRVALNNYSRSRSNSRGRDISGSRVGSRQRAESVNATLRQSIYLDEDEHADDVGMVLDEQPPTDLEGGSDEEEEEHDVYSQNVMPHPNGSISSPSLALVGSQLGQSDARHRAAQSSVSRIPTPVSHRQMSAPPRTPTPTKPIRGASEGASSSAPTTPRSQRLPRSQSQPYSQTQGQRASPTAKRKAKSPAATPSVSTTKKAKTKPPSSMRKTAPRNDENRRSIGQYPAPDGDDVVDAIPSWTQPIPPSGNWDDVVLPVVARKKGLEGHYATADGSPRLKQNTNSNIYEPAPGTFGYDHTKYRRQQYNDGEEHIPMDEFGHKMDGVKEDVRAVDEQPRPQSPATVKLNELDIDRARLRPSPPPSPPPFAHYTASHGADQSGVEIIRPHETQKVQEAIADEDRGAGCCRCIIM